MVKLNRNILCIAYVVIFVVLFCITSYAAQENSSQVFLYFYTVDGDEIESLEKKINTNTIYTFKDPDKYKYIEYDDGNGGKVTNELASQVKGICWEELINGKNSGKTYKSGDMLKLDPGEHYFIVKTDHPELTGENTMNLSDSEKVHLIFFTANYEDEIDSLNKELSPEEDYIFPDPTGYASINGTSSYKGLYWHCTDDNGKSYLFKKGDKARFNAGSYEMRVVTDEPVTIRYRYPIDVDSLLNGHDPGDIYATVNASVGDTIMLKKSLGAIVFGYSFKGWEETNYDFNKYKGGQTYKIMDNEDLSFFAIYEEDENWDPNAIDQNLTEEELTKADKDFIVSASDVNAAAGVGYGAYIDNEGTLKRKNGGVAINSNTTIKGVPGEIKGSTSLTSLTDNNAKKDPTAYTKDKYGRDAASSNISNTINGVLKQDDSALYMDVYGNSMIYHSSIGRIEDLCIAYIRLQNKNDSFASMVSNWDKASLDRFEAINFALLCDVYPGKINSPYNKFNSNDATVLKIKAVGGLTAEDKLPEWKNEYLSEKAFNELSSYKKIWSGWMDTYTDGLEELYMGTSNGTITVGDAASHIKDIVNRVLVALEDSFCITCYAADWNNESGIASQYGARLNTSMDIKGSVFVPQYFDPTKIFNFSTFGFTTLDGLDSQQMLNLQAIFDYLVNDMGFSKAMAAGVCGNLWQESSFKTNCGASGNGPIGLIQWAGNRKTNLLNYSSSKNLQWTSIDTQLGFMANELRGTYLAGVNKYLSQYGNGTSVSTINDPLVACDAWCAKYEGCTCKNGNSKNGGYHSSHSGNCAVASNGSSYQELKQRRKYATAVYNALVEYGGFGEGGSLAGMSNSEILMSLFGYPSKSEIQSHYTLSQLRAQCVSVRLSDGRSIVVHKAIAQDVADALNALMASGFKVDNTTYGYRTGANTSGGGYSFHNLGLAIDINCSASSSKSMGWAHNPQFYLKDYTNEQIRANYSPNTDPLAIGVKEANILSQYGLKWGRDFTTRPDIMHFSVGEVGTPGKNVWISNLVEGAR